MQAPAWELSPDRVVRARGTDLSSSVTVDERSPFKRVVLIVADSVGVGQMPDAAKFGDDGAATLQNVAAHLGGLNLPNLASLGLGNIVPVKGVPASPAPRAFYGKSAELSDAKDTTTGHWEIAGLPLQKPWSYFPKGFTGEIIDEFVRNAGLTGVLGNKASSGTVIIDELGPEHIRSGMPIVYTSADSVFQIAAHEEAFGLERLYEISAIAREILDRHQVARVIARPFVGSVDEGFKRTYNRHDYSMEPPGDTVLDILKAAGKSVVGVGKIGDIFAGKGLTKSVHTEGNVNGMEITANLLDEHDEGLIFVNLVDFDMLYGHRNNPEGYGASLEEFDSKLALLLGKLGAGDLLIITADHGCDPTFTVHTDHTREYVPIIAYNPANTTGKSLGVRSTFADIGATVADALGVAPTAVGTSFLEEVR